MMMTELGAENGFMRMRSRSINRLNVSIQNDPSTMSQCKMPSQRDSAGRTENLYDH